jgi:hypothetical protein
MAGSRDLTSAERCGEPVLGSITDGDRWLDGRAIFLVPRVGQRRPATQLAYFNLVKRLQAAGYGAQRSCARPASDRRP